MSQNDWPGRLTQVIADQVRRYRLARKMSAQGLSDRCATLGMEIPRPVLANLENGRRPIVSVAELLILAAALDVPPVVLVAPLGHAPNVGILPGRQIDTWDAALWISGEVRLSEDAADTEAEWLDLADERSIVPLYHQHDRLLEELESIGEGRIVLTDTANNVINVRARVVASLQAHRALMTERGLLLPPLAAGLEDIDSGPRRVRRVRSVPGEGGEQ
jgi:transcriptional regulator with XRE-family HTH domain